MGATPQDPPPALPVRLHRNAHLALVVTIPHPSAATLKKQRAGTLLIDFSAVGVPDANSPLEVPFLTRVDPKGSILPSAGADIDVS